MSAIDADVEAREARAAGAIASGAAFDVHQAPRRIAVTRAFWLVLALTAFPALGEPAQQPALSVAEIVAKNVEARGGLEAWRKIDTMIWVGRIRAERAPPEGLPFLLEMKRPRKTRFEIKAPTEQAVRAFDGQTGWKAHPGANGQPDVRPFTPEEVSFAKDGEGIDGLLIDCEAKGIKVTLDGKETVDGARAYRLRVVMPSGAVRHVWVDAQSFLEMQQDREGRTLAGAPAVVRVRYRDYKTVGGIKVATTIESGPPNGKVADTMVIERVAINSPLDDKIFSRPHVPRRNVVTITPDRASPPQPQSPVRPAPDAAQPPATDPNASPVPEPR